MMCDTLVALDNSTKDGSIILGKNSDRPQKEVQLIVYNPRAKYSKGEEVKCTYISIPQAFDTAAVLLSQPYWMWGAEMGANEFNVVIGNEAVYTHEPLKNVGLLGMDLLRLGLERGKTAVEALNVITNLLEKYGQGGGCAYDDPSWMYHNSFLIADSKDAYVLETADKWWIAEKVKDVRSISNSISIRGKGDFRRNGIIEHAIEKGYCKDDDDFDFTSTFSGSLIPSRPSPYSRGGKATILLKKNKGKITPNMMMEFLREHQAGICMHGGFESTGSQVSHLVNRTKSIHWFTGSTLPCLSIYKPYVFPVEEQKYFKPGPYTTINNEWFWNKHTKYIRPFSAISDNHERNNYIAKLRSIENDILRSTLNIIKDSKINNEEFIHNMNKINKEAWTKAENIIN